MLQKLYHWKNIPPSYQVGNILESLSSNDTYRIVSIDHQRVATLQLLENSDSVWVNYYLDKNMIEKILEDSATKKVE